jgi:hypothetical protein
MCLYSACLLLMLCMACDSFLLCYNMLLDYYICVYHASFFNNWYQKLEIPQECEFMRYLGSGYVTYQFHRKSLGLLVTCTSHFTAKEAWFPRIWKIEIRYHFSEFNNEPNPPTKKRTRIWQHHNTENGEVV